MNKMKKMLMMMVAMVFAVAALSPFANAQELDVATILNEVNNANKSLESVQGDFNGSILLVSDEETNVDLKLSGPFKFNMGDTIGLETELQADGEADGDAISELIKLTIVNSMLYAFDGTEWTVQDISEEEGEFLTSVKDAQAQAESMDPTAVNEKMAAYYDVEDNGDSYVVRLKEDIDPTAFWADMSEVIDVEAIKAQVLSQAEANGLEMSEEDRQMFDGFFQMGLNLAVNAFNKLEMHYAKDTYKMTKMILSLSLNETMVAELLGMTTEGLGTTFTGNLDVELNLTNHGVDSDIQVPADAPTEPTEPASEDEAESEDAYEEDMGEEVSEDTMEEETSAE